MYVKIHTIMHVIALRSVFIQSLLDVLKLMLPAMQTKFCRSCPTMSKGELYLYSHIGGVNI